MDIKRVRVRKKHGKRFPGTCVCACVSACACALEQLAGSSASVREPEHSAIRKCGGSEAAKCHLGRR